MKLRIAETTDKITDLIKGHVAMLKKRYKKIRYTLGWKYPWLYSKLSSAVFPAQLLLLCVSLLALVGFYQKHYSFEATMRASENKSTTDYIHPLSPAHTGISTKNTTVHNEASAITTTPRTVILQSAVEQAATQPEVVPASLTRDNSLSAAVTKTEIQKSDDALLAEVIKAEAWLRQKKQQTKRLEARVERARQLLRSAETNTAEQQEPKTRLLTGEWVQQQPENHFVVQIASSTNFELLQDYATRNPLTAPLAIYPYKVSKTGNVVYGLSTGLFIDRQDAMNELPRLTEISKRHGVWVRKIADLKTNLASLEQLQLLQ